MDTIEKNIQSLVSAVRRSPAYREYKKQEERIAADAQLQARLDEFRAKSFHMQQETDKEHLMLVGDELAKEAAQLRKNPEVNAYLDAELALCKLMQRVCLEVTAGINMHIPDL